MSKWQEGLPAPPNNKVWLVWLARKRQGAWTVSLAHTIALKETVIYRIDGQLYRTDELKGQLKWQHAELPEPPEE